MLRTVVTTLLVMLCFATLGAALTPLEEVPIPERKAIGPDQTPTATPVPPPHEMPSPVFHLDDAIGIADTAGFTYYDWQHNATVGKMIGVDPFGSAHVCWTNALDPLYATRYVFYNIWDPAMGDFMHDPTAPLRIDASTRAGFVTAIVNEDGFCFPSYHQVLTGDVAHAAVSIDYCAYCGAFTTREPTCLDHGQFIFPKIAMDVNGEIHVTTYEWEGSDRMYYAQGHPVFDQDGFGLDIEWTDNCFVVGTSSFINHDMAASRHSERIAIAWLSETGDAYGGDNVFILVSEDAGANWGEPINVTNFTPPDEDCFNAGGEPSVCNRDTLKPWLDLAILFDENDYIHLAWGSYAWMYWGDDGSVGPWTYFFAGHIMHWGEDHNEFNIVADAWYGNNGQHEANSYNCNRPSLAVDPITNHLYCSYQLFDTVQYSDAMFPMADAWVTVSTNNGRSWALATNVSRSDGGVGTPSPGSRSETAISIAPAVQDGYLHMEYLLDLDAGASVHGEGLATRSPVIYQRIPVDSIATTPILDPCFPLHWDSTGYPWDLCEVAIDDIPSTPPSEFLLYPNYPNPFNPTTTIQFDLTRRTAMTLKVYNLLGQEVANLLNETPLSAGVHTVNFDASELPSGVYVYRLTSETHTASKKMVLLK